MALFEIKNEQKKESSQYTHKVQIPQYLPSDVKPPITALVDCVKYSQLMYNINNSSVSDEEKKFLRMAASRHLAFNYSLIADYYAHSDAEMQRLMEESALVIIDVDDAIANGYMKLSQHIKDMIKEDKDGQ